MGGKKVFLIFSLDNKENVNSGSNFLDPNIHRDLKQIVYHIFIVVHRNKTSLTLAM